MMEDRPSGCYMWVTGSVYLHNVVWNNHADGTKNDHKRVVCEKAMSSDSDVDEPEVEISDSLDDVCKEGFVPITSREECKGLGDDGRVHLEDGTVGRWWPESGGEDRPAGCYTHVVSGTPYYGNVVWNDHGDG